MALATALTSKNRVAAWALTLASAVAVEPPDANACSVPNSGIRARHVFPSDQSSGVPVNARVLVFYRVHTSGMPVDELGPDLELVTEQGDPVLVTREVTTTSTNFWDRELVVILKPRDPLAPGRRFQVRDRRPQVPCSPYGSEPTCALGTPTSFSSFTTGAAADTTPPSFAGLRSLAAGSSDVCDSSGCCGPFASALFGAAWDAGTDEVANREILYNVYAGGKLLVGLRKETALALGVSCGIRGSVSAVATQPGPHMVRAVDWAGNEDSNAVTLTVPADACANVRDGGARDGPDPSRPDASPDEAPTDTDNPDLVAWPDTSAVDGTAVEAGPPPVVAPPRPTAPAPRAGGSCSVSPRAGTAGLAPCLLLALAFMLPLRRRAGQRPRPT